MRGRREWIGPAVSFLLHTALAVLILVAFRHEAEPRDAPSSTGEAPVEPRDVSMIYIPPAPRASAPEPPPPARPPAPDAVAAPENRASRAPRVTEDAPSAPGEAAASPPKSESPQPAAPGETATSPESAVPAPRSAVPTLESEARRLFGSPGVRAGNLGGVRLGIGSAAELARNYEAERNNCRMTQRPPRRDGDPVEMGVATGRVLRADHRTPVANAFLQVLGTPWSTFTDGNGTYRLEFDASLVDNCRTQTVRVTANGYQMRDLILGVGYAPEDVVLNRF